MFTAIQHMFWRGRDALPKWAMKLMPQGDGHPVLVIPGFMSSDSFTASLRRALEMLGYDVYPWDQSSNLGLRDSTCEDLEQRLAEISRLTGGKVSLIGQSLGGVYVRAMAHRQAQ